MFGSVSMRMFVALVHIWAGFKKSTVLFYFLRVFVCLRMCIHCGFSSYDHKGAACSRGKPVFHLVFTISLYACMNFMNWC